MTTKPPPTKTCPGCNGSGKQGKTKNFCLTCGGLTKVLVKKKREPRPKVANQVPIYQPYTTKAYVKANCCQSIISLKGLVIDVAVSCTCGCVQVVRIYEKMVDINVPKEKWTESVII